MLKMNYEFRKGVLFIRLYGSLDHKNIKKISTNIADLIAEFGLKYIVFNLDDLIYIDKEGVNFILKYHNIINNQNGKLIICDKNDQFSRLNHNKLIPNITYEIDAFHLI